MHGLLGVAPRFLVQRAERMLLHAAGSTVMGPLDCSKAGVALIRLRTGLVVFAWPLGLDSETCGSCWLHANRFMPGHWLRTAEPLGKAA